VRRAPGSSPPVTLYAPAVPSPHASPGDLETPALLLDLDVMEANLASMADDLSARRIRLRPHAKTHKSAEVARRQIDYGGVGLTVATIGEAETFLEHGFDDLFIAYPLFAAGTKAKRMAELARRARLRIGVESLKSAEILAEALAGLPPGASPEVMIEIDCGQHRTGVPADAAGELAARCSALGLDVAGVFTHGGHSYSKDHSAAAVADDEDAALARAAEGLADRGIEVRELSAGSTPTARLAGSCVTEERPGTYVFNDRQQLALGSCRAEQVAVTVAATVVSTTVKGQAVIDAGSKALASDRPVWLVGHGSVPALDNAVVVSLSEHHGLVDLAAGPVPDVGTIVTVVPNHVCSTVNLFDRYTLVRSGEPVGSWPVDARGRLS
jgi:D-serine deaminase-like pyridoxal phosphate-dependent protein